MCIKTHSVKLKGMKINLKLELSLSSGMRGAHKILFDNNLRVENNS